ncbi:helix-turn-helix domain-containing protein [Aestuariirhabdus sp. Z084]|uniref:helix-turn-helix domain-containing protein n=1 Tax=Aestuariirhabdus haliotis TaxID=2918751 RepID=UPI00201B384C|nr:helix-turn-helix domain-containing protein [Aestuariirhabdus haliotis]MCL6416915.1 helix-turn-helix domain-containing protein [Aestuariirhabdus haliotis]MCL6420923.1 helix-turn-helix domain-containing protein [Aestuariirhabdus haliotis]
MTRDIAHSLIPEEFLLEQLPDNWRQRLTKAVLFLEQTLDQTPPPAWKQVAEHCAISPFHFHRLFKAAFHETPSQYLKRLRLKRAVQLLFDEPDWSVTDIALGCGFSSSQALAKALKREIGLSALAIRDLRNRSYPEEFELILAKLGHPEKTQQSTIERHLADKIEYQVVQCAQREFWSQTLCPPSLQGVARVHQDFGQHFSGPLVEIMAATEDDKPYHQQTLHLGYALTGTEPKQPLPSFKRFIIPAGYFLCSRVRVASETGYIIAWEALYEYLMAHNLEPDPRGYCIEEIYNPEQLLVDNAAIEIRLSLSIKQP